MKKSVHLKAIQNETVTQMPVVPRGRAWLAKWWPYLLLVTLSAGIYAFSIGADFLRWDDRQNILLNPWIEHKAWNLIWTRPYYNMYIPVTYSLWTVMWHITNQPWLFHLANVALHALNVVLVYMVARKLLRPEERTAALFAALIFGCHPLQVETVAWISTFRDVLSTAFALGAVYLMLASERKLVWLLATALFCTSLLSKPSVAVIPAAMLFLTYGLNQLTRSKAIVYLLWFIPALAASYVTKMVQQLDADLRLTPMGLGDRILVAIDTLTFYLMKFFAPYPLASDYGRVREVALAENLWIIGLGCAAGLGVLAFAFRKQISQRMYYFAGTFVLLLAPVLGIIPFQAQGTSTVSDRYVYVSLIAAGLFFGVVLAYRKMWIFGALWIAVLSIMTISRAEVWEGNEVFFRDMLAKNERSHVALSSLGVEFILANRLPEAEDVLNRAVKLRPMDVIPRTNLAQLYLLQGRPDRVTSEVVPLLENDEFQRINQTETRALASAYRLAARAYWSMGIWSKANVYFCRWFNLDYENEEGKAEIGRFLADAKAKGAAIPNCEIVPRF
ncbi:MAG: glycosyltransferase family 39 protein [Bdellovibrionales bacterium]|nr:glycosyltransferase family 39 protein [Bdellovibrionales bacterium]